MWIRSQNRNVLVNADKFSISKEHEVFRIYSVNYFLGEYSTEENAIKVMDMIQKQIGFCSEGYEIVRPVLKSDPFEPYWRKREVVFNMPKDEEVEV